VPIAPGGSADDPPVYAPAELGQVSFGIWLDPELRGDAQAYLRQRAQLCLAGFGVQLFEVAEGGEQPAANSMLLQGADGTIRLDAAQLKPGVVYGWRVVAALQDGSTVYSTPLYFAVDQAAPDTTDPDPLSGLCALLDRLSLAQSREAAALSVYLAGGYIFETYPTASDSYICAPVGGGGLLPFPAQGSGAVPVQILPLLGRLMEQAQAVQDAVRTSGKPQPQAAELAVQAQQLLGSVSYGPALSARAPALGATLARLAAAKAADQQVALLSELQLALDSAIGYGSLNVRQDYRDALAAYTDEADARLSDVVDRQALLVQVFGADASDKLLTLLADQRGALALLRQEVGRGRLGKTQVAQRLAQSRARVEQSGATAYEFIDGARCAMLEANHHSPADVRSAQQELVRCKLLRLLTSVWPGE